MAAERQSDRMVSDMEVHIKKKCGTEFLHTEKIALINIHGHLPNVFEDRMVDMSAVRLHGLLRGGNSDMKEKLCSGWS